MRACPDDLEPCRRQGCGAGLCMRTREAPLAVCFECGGVVTTHAVVLACVACVHEQAPREEQET